MKFSHHSHRSKGKKKKMTKIIYILTAAISLATILQAAETTDSVPSSAAASVPTLHDIQEERNDSIFFDSGLQKKRPWRAAIETFGLNVGVWAFDRYVMNEDFAHISMRTVSHNIKNGFVWDNDQFSTNLFAHPYHGGLYFNTARCNGLSFWESAPYALCGSLMWETCAEIEPPAINDLMATTIGGIALGEVTHKVSALVLDDSKRGFQRFWREVLGTLICPMRGLNRIITGEAWKVKHKGYLYHNYEETPVAFSISAGERYMADNNQLFKGETNPYIEFRCTYGDPFDKENDRPYDYFTATLQMGLSPNQPLISKINLLGKLWSTSVQTPTGMDVTFGIYQHFNYFDSEPVLDFSDFTPYKISEAASLGPGIIYRFPQINSLANIEQSIFLSGILLGGGLTDYYNVIDRNYNMGSGYSIKNRTTVNFKQYGRFALNIHLYQIFTWKGYETKTDIAQSNPLYLNSQGDKGNVLLGIVNPEIELNLGDHLALNLGMSYYHRHTHYSYHNDVRFRTFETRIGATYNF